MFLRSARGDTLPRSALSCNVLLRLVEVPASLLGLLGFGEDRNGLLILGGA